MSRNKPPRREKPTPGAGRERRPEPPRRTPVAPGGGGPFRAPSPDVVTIYGSHAVRAALTAGRRKLLTLYATAVALPRIEDAARAAGLTPRVVENRDLDQRLGPDAVHQGLLLEARPLPEADIADIASNSGLVLVLDQITDPQNVGAILRSACAFGVDALIVTERHSPAFTGVLAKTASGALEHVTIVSVVNLARALDQLRDQGYSVVGLDSDGEHSIETLPLATPLALVLGAEGKGLRRLTRERCDAVARLDLPGPIRSLNVSNAAAAVLAVARLRLRDNRRD
jgi:23S rRNA (guanosine2251-2'-O)-methyltransferase